MASLVRTLTKARTRPKWWQLVHYGRIQADRNKRIAEFEQALIKQGKDPSERKRPTRAPNRPRPKEPPKVRAKRIATKRARQIEAGNEQAIKFAQHLARKHHQIG